MAILLLADHNNKFLTDHTAKALTAASKFEEEVHILVAGFNSAPVAQQASLLSNVAKVFHADHPILEHQIAEHISDIIISIAQRYNTFIAAATSVGKSVMPRVAALLDVPQISEVSDVLNNFTFKRAIYAGNAIQTVETTDPVKVFTVRTSSFSAVGAGGRAEIEQIEYTPNIAASFFVSEDLSSLDRPELTTAKIIVSGGRALGSADNFEKLMLPFAEKLGAAVGASRAAVDAGFAPNDWQVGQTGKIVAPHIYIACGISGAIQHLAGMKDSKFIVAINKDDEAPIFQVADIGLVADIFEALPELTKEL